MSPAPLRVLVAENQYLIAMEVERLLGETLPCDVTIVPLAQLSAAVAAGSFDVVIVEAVLTESQNRERAQLIMQGGAKPVFLSSYDHPAVNEALASVHPIVAKPPQSDELAAAVLKASHRHSQSDGEGLLDDG